MKKEIIPIFFAIDDHYAPYLSAALVTLMEHANRAYTYKLYILYENISEENRQKLEKLRIDEAFELHFVSMKEKLTTFHEKITNKLRCDYFTLTIYFRLFIPDMFPQYDKGLYIDSDIVVPGDISELYHEDLGNDPIGACVDFSIQNAKPLCDYIDQAVGVDHTKYVNSGVLLMNLKMLREMRFSENFLNLLNTQKFDSIAPDQDYINAMLEGHIHFLNNRWDLFPEEGVSEDPNPGLVHYNLFAKPWCYKGLPYETYFWEAMKKTPYEEEVKAHLENYSEKQREEDTENLKMMAVRGQEIIDHGVRFKDYFGTGAEKEEKRVWLHREEKR